MLTIQRSERAAYEEHTDTKASDWPWTYTKGHIMPNYENIVYLYIKITEFIICEGSLNPGAGSRRILPQFDREPHARSFPNGPMSAQVPMTPLTPSYAPHRSPCNLCSMSAPALYSSARTHAAQVSVGLRCHARSYLLPHPQCLSTCPASSHAAAGWADMVFGTLHSPNERAATSTTRSREGLRRPGSPWERGLEGSWGEGSCWNGPGCRHFPEP